MVKVVGLILMLLGIAALVASLLFKTAIAKIPFVASLNSLWISAAGVVLIILGALILKTKKIKTEKEVPIYEGNKIVGYRRK